MPRRVQVAVASMWCLALAVAVSSSVYFVMPARLPFRNQSLALGRHHNWILLHIAGGMVAITVGPFQFVGRLRESHPAVHRALGYAYLVSVLAAGSMAVWLSPDTSVFAADGLADLNRIDLSFLGLSPSFLGYSSSARYSPSQFRLVVVGFAALAVTWLFTSAMAFVRARQRRYFEHRAWMVRSYSLTFAAATVRLLGLPFLVLTRSPVVAVIWTFWSWVLNLMVAEWIVRRDREPALSAEAV